MGDEMGAKPPRMQALKPSRRFSITRFAPSTASNSTRKRLKMSFNLPARLYIEDMVASRPYSGLIEQLKSAGLRPTRQRLALSRLLFEGEGADDRHVTAEQLHGEALENGIRVSLATIYNTLNQFTRAGLLREVVVEPGRSYFDTNVDDHHHFFFEGTGRLMDIPGDSVQLKRLPEAPPGARVRRVDVIIRLEDEE